MRRWGKSGSGFQRPRSAQNFLGAEPHAKIFGEIAPAHDAVVVDQKLRGPRDVASVLADSFVQDIVFADDGRVGVGEKRVRVTPLARVLARELRRVDADRDDADPERVELAEVLLDTP